MEGVYCDLLGVSSLGLPFVDVCMICVFRSLRLGAVCGGHAGACVPCGSLGGGDAAVISTTKSCEAVVSLQSTVQKTFALSAYWALRIACGGRAGAPPPPAQPLGPPSVPPSAGRVGFGERLGSSAGHFEVTATLRCPLGFPRRPRRPSPPHHLGPRPAMDATSVTVSFANVTHANKEGPRAGSPARNEPPGRLAWRAGVSERVSGWVVPACLGGCRCWPPPTHWCRCVGLRPRCPIPRGARPAGRWSRAWSSWGRPSSAWRWWSAAPRAGASPRRTRRPWCSSRRRRRRGQGCAGIPKFPWVSGGLGWVRPPTRTFHISGGANF